MIFSLLLSAALQAGRQPAECPWGWGLGCLEEGVGGGPQPDASGSVRGVKGSSRWKRERRGPVTGVQLAFDRLDCGACGVWTKAHLSVHTMQTCTYTRALENYLYQLV